MLLTFKLVYFITLIFIVVIKIHIFLKFTFCFLKIQTFMRLFWGGGCEPCIEDFICSSRLCSTIDTIYYEIVRNLTIIIDYK